MNLKRILGRLMQMVGTLIGVSFLTFCLTWLAPGDPVSMLLETADTVVSAELVEQTRHDLGLDQPFLVQYVHWAGGVLHGDMGMSYSAKKPVVDKLLEGFAGTLLLAIVTIIFVLVISLPLGIWSAVKRNKL
ncbi:ABC transporter permease, partial [Anaerovibrio lipolyticus]